MQQPIFITGIGTDVGKTLVSAIVTEALQANYWKPVQAGFATGTDAQTVADYISHPNTHFFPETYRLAMPASPHIAAAAENKRIDLNLLVKDFQQFSTQSNNRPLIIEGAGGLLVPLNETATVADLIQLLQAKLILVSRNYLGSINHSLLTAHYCATKGLDVAGWIFSDQYLDYEASISEWTGYPILGRVPQLSTINKAVIKSLAAEMAPALQNILTN